MERYVPAVSYGKNLRSFRIKKDYSQAYVALKLGITQSQYSKLERGSLTLTFFIAHRLSEILGFSLDDLSDGRSNNSGTNRARPANSDAMRMKELLDKLSIYLKA